MDTQSGNCVSLGVNTVVRLGSLSIEPMRPPESVIKKYNQPSGILVVSSYPKRDEVHSKDVCAVASVARNTLKSIRLASPTTPITVLTMQQDKEEWYEEDCMLVIRCLKRNSFSSYLNILSYAKRFSSIANCLIEFEFASFGDSLITTFFPVTLFCLSLLGKRVSLVLHQVLYNLGCLSGHIGVANNSLQMMFLSSFLKHYLKILLYAPSHIIVFEEVLKRRLTALGITKRITVIPHGVEDHVSKLTKGEAKKRLGMSPSEKLVLYFGYLTWYKGADLLLKAFAKSPMLRKDNIRVILAGGPSFTQRNKKHYKKYISSLETTASHNARAQITGFIPEKDIEVYFAASDLVVFPYRTCMSSSGAFSLTLSFEKPFLLSSALKPWLKGASSMYNNLFFTVQKASLRRKITQALIPSQQRELCHLSQNLKEERLYKHLGPLYLSIVAPKEVSPVSVRPTLSLSLGG